MPDDIAPPTLLGEPASAPPPAPPAGGDAPPPAPPTNPPAQWVGEDGKFTEGWADRLPPEYADYKLTAARHQSLPDLVKAYHNARQEISKKGIIPINEKSTPEQIAEYRKATGVPETPEGYGLKPENLPEGMEWSAATEKKFAEIAHQHNIPAPAMKALAAAQVAIDQQRMSEAINMAKENLEAGRNALRDEWKGEYAGNIALAERAAKTVGLDVNSPGLTDPNVVKALARMANMMSEDKLVKGDTSPMAHPGRARADAIMRGPMVTSDPEVLRLHALYQKGDAATAKMVNDMLQNG